jgi:transposase-like protein
VELGLVEQRHQAVREMLTDGASVTDVARRNGVVRRSTSGWRDTPTGALSDLTVEARGTRADVQRRQERLLVVGKGTRHPTHRPRSHEPGRDSGRGRDKRDE